MKRARRTRDARILVVEDDEMQVRLLKRRLTSYLGERAFQVHIVTAKTRAEAIALVQGRDPIDVAVLDIGLPTATAQNEYEEGMAVVKRLLGKRIAIVVVTAIQTAGFQRLTEKHGIDTKKLMSLPVFSKPSPADDVCKAVANLLRRRNGR